MAEVVAEEEGLVGEEQHSEVVAPAEEEQEQEQELVEVSRDSSEYDQRPFWRLLDNTSDKLLSFIQEMFDQCLCAGQLSSYHAVYVCQSSGK